MPMLESSRIDGGNTPHVHYTRGECSTSPQQGNERHSSGRFKRSKTICMRVGKTKISIKYRRYFPNRARAL